MNDSLEETNIGTLKFNSPDVNSTKKLPILQRIGFRSNGCTCQDLSCNCCLGINMEQFQVNREGTNELNNNSAPKTILCNCADCESSSNCLEYWLFSSFQAVFAFLSRYPTIISYRIVFVPTNTINLLNKFKIEK